MKTFLAPSRPAIRYHGGKWLLAPWIISHFPQHRIYVEPYGGAASVLLRKPRAYSEVYNDTDGEVVNLFRVLRDYGLSEKLHRDLRLTPFARDEFKAAYEPTEDPVERARRTIIRSYQGFGSASVNPNYSTGFRSHSNRSGTTPAHDWVNYPQNLLSLTLRLQGVVIENRDALDLVRIHDTSETLFYLDPTYLHDTRNTNCKQYTRELTEEDHRALAAALHCINGKAIISGYPSDLYDRELFPDWRREAKKFYAGNNKGQSKRTEVLWMNF